MIDPVLAHEGEEEEPFILQSFGNSAYLFSSKNPLEREKYEGYFAFAVRETQNDFV